MSNLKSKIKKTIDHKKRIRDWSIFYLVLSAINAGTYGYIMIETESTIFGIFMIPALIMAVLAYLMLHFKNRLTAGIFLAYYLLIFLINISISSVSDGSSAGSLLFLVGLVGIFQCYGSAKKINLKKNKAPVSETKNDIEDNKIIHNEEVVSSNDTYLSFEKNQTLLTTVLVVLGFIGLFLLVIEISSRKEVDDAGGNFSSHYLDEGEQEEETAQDWEYILHDDKDDQRGETLEQQADTVHTIHDEQFPKGKCVTEYGVKICDLSHNVQKTYKNGTRKIKFQANLINCVNVATGNQIQNKGNSIQVGSGNTYCVSDFGSVYIDPTIEVVKYFNDIIRDNYNSPYYLSDIYETCIWTYAEGNAVIPDVKVSDNVGPSSGFYVKAFCKNGNNQVDIYTYKENY